MQMNTVIRLGLENRVAEMLAAQMSYSDIARTLSQETGVKIQQPTITRYLQSNNRVLIEAVHSSPILKETVLQAEMDTVKERKYIIDRIHRLGEMAEERGDYRTAIAACAPHTAAIDSLDRVVGKYRDHDLQVNMAVQVNNDSDKKFDQFIQHIMSKDDPVLREKITVILKELI